MIVLISDRSLNYQDNNILVVKSMLEASKVVGGLEALIIHRTSEDPSDFATHLSKIKENGLDKLVYISNPENKQDIIEMFVIGNGGTILEDEFFLEDEEVLKSTLGVSEGNNLSIVSGLNVIDNFVSRYIDSEDNSPVPQGYLRVVQSASIQLAKEFENKTAQVIKISQEASEVIEEVALNNNEILKQKAEALRSLEELGNLAKGFQGGSSQANGGTAFYPMVSYLKEKDIVRIKDIGNTPYLHSFVHGLQSYADGVLHKRCKMIVVMPVGGLYQVMYDKFKWITKENYKDRSLYSQNIVYTNHPSKTVLEQLLNDNTYSLFIVVDFTTNSNKHILNTRRSRSVRYALSSSRFIESLKRDVSITEFKYFTSIKEYEGNLFTIPYLELPKDTFSRVNLYLRECAQSYDKILQRG